MTMFYLKKYVEKLQIVRSKVSIFFRLYLYVFKVEITNKDYDIVPLFVKDEEGELHIISSYNKDIKEVQKGFKLVYLGKPLETVV